MGRGKVGTGDFFIRWPFRLSLAPLSAPGSPRMGFYANALKTKHNGKKRFCIDVSLCVHMNRPPCGAKLIADKSLKEEYSSIIVSFSLQKYYQRYPAIADLICAALEITHFEKEKNAFYHCVTGQRDDRLNLFYFHLLRL